MDTTTEFGGSLPVENVQALASDNSRGIPMQYIRSEVSSDDVLDDRSVQIPVIDMSKLVNDQLLHDDDELAKLHLACKTWGFFQVYLF